MESQRQMCVHGLVQEDGAVWCHGGMDGREAWQSWCIDLSGRWDGGRWWRQSLERAHAVHATKRLFQPVGTLES